MRAYELFEGAQIAALSRPEPDRHLAVATSRGWTDVECLMNYALVVSAFDRGDDVRPIVRRMIDAARQAGDDVLLGLATATQVAQGALGDEPFGQSAASRELASAVATLDASTSESPHLPAAYVECAQAYLHWDLWELAVELIQRARDVLDAGGPAFADAEGRRIAELTRRRAAMVGLNVALAPVCRLLEGGERQAARDLAEAYCDLDPAELEGLPEYREYEVAAHRTLLEAVAGRPRSIDLEEQLLTGLPPLHRQRFRAAVWLSRAIRADDAGDRAGAAAAAEIALKHADRAMLGAVRSLALCLATINEHEDFVVRRYRQELLSSVERARRTMLNAARGGLESARLLLETGLLSQQAHVDELTGLPNRYAYARYLNRLRAGMPDRQLPAVRSAIPDRRRSDAESNGAASSRGVVALMMDVDNFKEINDTFGHAVGDEVLRRMGALLTHTTRGTDFAVRLGGDEFLLLLRGTPLLDVDERGRHLVETVRRYQWGELMPNLSVTVSVGVAVGRSPQIDELIAMADEALYRAKEQGRDRAVQAWSGDLEVVKDRASAQRRAWLVAGGGTGTTVDDLDDDLDASGKDVRPEAVQPG